MTTTYRWDGGYTPFRRLDGQQIEVIRPLIVPDEVDAEVGTMYRARFPDGIERDVYADEVNDTGGTA